MNFRIEQNIYWLIKIDMCHRTKSHVSADEESCVRRPRVMCQKTKSNVSED